MMVILLGIYFYTWKMMEIVNLYKDAAGLWEHDKYRPITAATINLILNIIGREKQGGHLTRYFKSKEVDVYEVNVFEKTGNQAPNGIAEQHDTSSILQNLPQQFPSKVDLIVCIDVLNDFFAHEN